VNSGIRELWCENIEANRGRPGELLTICQPLFEAGVGFRSTDRGQSWSYLPIGSAIPNCWVDEVRAHPKRPELYAAAGLHCAGILVSEDRGLHWRYHPLSFAVSHVTFAPGSHTDIYAWGEEDIFVSKDAGKTWRRARLQGLEGFRSFFSLAVHPQNSKILYLGNWLGVLYKSFDRGETWKNSSKGLPPKSIDFGPIESIAIDETNPQVMYLTRWDPNDLFKSVDGGKTWKVSSTGIDEDVDRVKVDPFNSNRVIASSYGDIYVSLDAAKTWTEVNYTGLPPYGYSDIAVNPWNDNSLFMALTRGIFRSVLKPAASNSVFESTWNSAAILKQLPLLVPGMSRELRLQPASF
jgi:photosystem II stability/assembly factor-like uncharacterized protein